MTIMLIVCVASEKCEILMARHVRAARALLDWTQADLARRAKVVRRTIVAVETGRVRCQPRKVEAMLAAFRAAGVEFVFGKDGVVSLVDSSSRLTAAAGSDKFDPTYQATDSRIAKARGRSLLTMRVSGRRRAAG